MSARTVAVPLDAPAASVTFQLDPNVKLQVESIYATVDNTAGGDTRPELVVADQTEAVIATKRQGETIPAGDTGSATWALRLDDEGTGGPPTSPLEVTDGTTHVTHVVILNEDGTWFVVDDLGGGQARVRPGPKLVGFEKTNAGTNLDLTAANRFQATVAVLARLALTTGEVDFSVQKSGAIGVVESVLNHAADVFRIIDASGAQVVQVLGSSDVTINLRLGHKFIVNDHLGNPLVTYTG